MEACSCSKPVLAVEGDQEMFPSHTDLVVGERVVGDGEDGDDVVLDEQPHQSGD